MFLKSERKDKLGPGAELALGRWGQPLLAVVTPSVCWGTFGGQGLGRGASPVPYQELRPCPDPLCILPGDSGTLSSGTIQLRVKPELQLRLTPCTVFGAPTGHRCSGGSRVPR